MNTEFYKQMLEIKRKKEISIRGLAKECGLCYATLIEFFNTDKEFRPLSDLNKDRIHNRLGIEYSVMDDYNKYVYESRKGE